MPFTKLASQIYLDRLKQSMSRFGLFLLKCSPVFAESVQNGDLNEVMLNQNDSCGGIHSYILVTIFRDFPHFVQRSASAYPGWITSSFTVWFFAHSASDSEINSGPLSM